MDADTAIKEWIVEWLLDNLLRGDGALERLLEVAGSSPETVALVGDVLWDVLLQIVLPVVVIVIVILVLVATCYCYCCGCPAVRCCRARK